MQLQQLLPFTVLKPSRQMMPVAILAVATALTVYGIETVKDGQVFGPMG